jgi:hypothetical protein
LQSAGPEPIFEDGSPTFVVNAGGKLGDVIRGRIGLDSGNLPEIIDSMGRVRSTATDAKNEKASTRGSKVRKHYGGGFDLGNVQ